MGDNERRDGEGRERVGPDESGGEASDPTGAAGTAGVPGDGGNRDDGGNDFGNVDDGDNIDDDGKIEDDDADGLAALGARVKLDWREWVRMWGPWVAWAVVVAAVS